MKILVVTQYFWPESFIINDLVCTLVSQGNTVEVLTGKPNYPDGKIFSGYEEQGLFEESFGPGVLVHRVPLRPRKSGGAKNLLLNYLSFLTNGLRHFHRALGGRSFDVVLVFALSPITSAIPGIFLKWRLRSHLAIWVQDLWPDSLSATGFIRNRFVLWAVGCLVRMIYACADTVLVQSRAFFGPVGRYALPEKILYYPNSYSDRSRVASTNDGLPAYLISVLKNSFCVVFAGNLGTAQSVETIVGAAARLAHLPECKFVLVGSGCMLGWLEAQKAEIGLENLVLAGRLPASSMPDLFSHAAALLVSLKREEIFAYTIPSKIQAYLAAGRPILAALDGEGARLIEDSGAGLTCPAEDAGQLAYCVERLFAMSQDERDQMGRAGRAYFLEHFEMERQAKRLIEILADRIGIPKEGI